MVRARGRGPEGIEGGRPRIDVNVDARMLETQRPERFTVTGFAHECGAVRGAVPNAKVVAVLDGSQFVKVLEAL